MLTCLLRIFVKIDELNLRREVFTMAYRDKKRAIEMVNKYQKDHYDRITVMAQKGRKERYKQAANLKGMSLSAFIESCVEKELSRMME